MRAAALTHAGEQALDARLTGTPDGKFQERGPQLDAHIVLRVESRRTSSQRQDIPTIPFCLRRHDDIRTQLVLDDSDKYVPGTGCAWHEGPQMAGQAGQALRTA